ncbi:MAG: cobalamin biosynthesis protein CbiA, partial [Deltaproteobacteria bacterium]|nr:cobalamin biosynthesis protein CbiA [Deltaproteobacteria bacterium]
DLPILSPTIGGMIRQPDDLVILDVGGDDAGAMVLAALADAFSGGQVHMLQVVNPLRPRTTTVEGCLKIRDEIEKAAHLTISGLIGNANLVDETGTEEIYSGYDFLQKLSAASGLPLEFITIAQELLPDIEIQRFTCPVLTIARQLVPPWKEAGEFGDSFS